MSDVRDLERALGPWLEEVASPRVPAYFDEMIGQAVKGRQRPGWLATGVRSALPGPVARLDQRLAAVAVVAALLAALAAGAAIGSRLLDRTIAPAPVERIEGLLSLPWQDTPMEAGPEIARIVDEECLGGRELATRPLNRFVLDYRGGDQLYAIYADDAGWVICGIAEGPDGDLTSWYSPLSPEDNPRPAQLTNFGIENVEDVGGPLSTGTEQGMGLFAGGRIAPGIAKVDLVFETGLRVHASVGGGFYGAWWQAGPTEEFLQNGRPLGPLDQPMYEGFDASDRLITDRFGYLLPDP
jgi:hypothetical protein